MPSSARESLDEGQLAEAEPALRCSAACTESIPQSLQALMKGNWRKAYDYLASVSSWSLLPNKTEVLDMMKAKLQECGLRTYLLSYGSFYRSLSQEQLCKMFDLPDKQVSWRPLGVSRCLSPCVLYWLCPRSSCARCLTCPTSR